MLHSYLNIGITFAFLKNEILRCNSYYIDTFGRKELRDHLVSRFLREVGRETPGKGGKVV